MKRQSYHQCLIPVLFFLWVTLFSTSSAASDIQFGGHFKLSGSLSFHDDDSIFSLSDSGTYLDRQSSVRLKNILYFSHWCYFETHYEAVDSGGDTTHSMNELSAMFLTNDMENIFANRINDNRRLMNLTRAIKEENGYAYLCHGRRQGPGQIQRRRGKRAFFQRRREIPRRAAKTKAGL